MAEDREAKPTTLEEQKGPQLSTITSEVQPLADSAQDGGGPGPGLRVLHPRQPGRRQHPPQVPPEQPEELPQHRPLHELVGVAEPLLLFTTTEGGHL